MQDGTEKNSPALGSETKSPQQEVQVTSENLPKNVSMQLYKLMNKVVQEEVTPKTVQAACACATEIHRMLKLNLEIKRSLP